jgi:hypothetical protein
LRRGAAIGRAALLAGALGAGVLGGAGCLAPWPSPSPTSAAAVATGTAPNDVALTTCSGRRTALVAASADARVDVLDLAGDVDDGDRVAPQAVFLGEGSNPWSVAPAPDGRAVATLFGADAVALIDACGARDLDRAVVDAVLPVEPITLPVAVDADGDGQEETTVTQLRPRAPQAVVVVDGVAFVTWTNVLAYSFDGAPMQTGPGMVARFVVDGDRLVFDRIARLPCENPQGIAAGDADDVIVTCTGRFVVDAGAHRRVSSGGIARVGRATLDLRAFAALQASPGTPALVGGDIVVGDVLDGRVMRFDAALVLLQQTAPADGVESVFVVVVDDAGRPLAGRFGSGEVLVDPFGDAALVRLQPRGPTRGLIDVVVDGEDLFGLFSLSSELVRGALP